MNTRSIKKKNLDQGVYDRIIEKIINVEFLPGQQLDINDLAEEFGVSRTPVVQAIKMLNLDNILEISRTGKVSIPDFTIKQIRDIYDVRLMMENFSGAEDSYNTARSILWLLEKSNAPLDGHAIRTALLEATRGLGDTAYANGLLNDARLYYQSLREMCMQSKEQTDLVKQLHLHVCRRLADAAADRRGTDSTLETLLQEESELVGSGEFSAAQREETRRRCEALPLVAKLYDESDTYTGRIHAACNESVETRTALLEKQLSLCDKARQLHGTSYALYRCTMTCFVAAIVVLDDPSAALSWCLRAERYNEGISRNSALWCDRLYGETGLHAALVRQLTKEQE